jgi:EAL domain-containing protein (putative c-di-GMP-specific phosphodiesterase class I)
METRAKYVIFLLDCCHSGAFCPSFKGEESQTQKKLIEEQFFSGEGRIAFVSSPRGITSRESKEFRNGIFTYYLLKGLKGKAVEPYTGEVTMNSLISYVQAMCPSNQLALQYGKSTRIILTQPENVVINLTDLTPTKPMFKIYESVKFASAKTEQKVKVTPLSNPIDKHIEYVDYLLQHLRSVSQDITIPVGDRVLSAVRCSVDAEFAFIQRIEPDKDVVYKFQSDFARKDIDINDYKNKVLGKGLSNIYPSFIWKKSELLSKRFGFYKPFKSPKDLSKYLVVIPLRIEYPREFLILCGVKDTQLHFGEILGCTLISLYNATSELTSLQIPKIETMILDDLKRDFGQVPYKIYKRRFSKFKEYLAKVTFSYEPVVCLGKKDLEIDSWEALARDPDTKRAPYELFLAAELWGPEFITELDLYCLRNAVSNYTRIWQVERKGQKVDPLSVNVYPETLFRAVYKSELTKIVKEEDLIKGKKLILEISEKRPLPVVDRMDDKISIHSGPVDPFMEKLHEYSKLNIGFAIDDFGVEHASVARLARLGLDHVKIDRDILHYPHPECTLKYVLELVSRCHLAHPIKIVVEGFDGDSNISLANLYNLGVEYVQGHLVRRASPTVSDLDQEIKDHLLRLLSG